MPSKKKKAIVPSDNSTSSTKIKVIGIGGGGSSIVSEISTEIKRVGFIAANTDKRALQEIKGKAKPFQFGESITSGFGTGMNSDLGREAALSDKEKIKKLFEGQDMIIIVSSLGGGTGAGAVPVFAKIAKEMGVITYGIFTLPFNFEGAKKREIALEALNQAKVDLNAITILPNENIFKIIDKKTPLKEALSIINRNLSKSLEGLIETIYGAGVINIDFADLKTILEGRGKLTYLSTVELDLTKEMEEAVKRATTSPFYSYGIAGASGILFNISGSDKLGLKDVSFISEGISSLVSKSSKTIFGISKDSRIGEKIRITLLAVGCESEELFPQEKKREVKKKKKVNNREKRVDIQIRKEKLEPTDGDDAWEAPSFIRHKL